MNDENTGRLPEDDLNKPDQPDETTEDSILDTTVVPGGSRRLRKKVSEPAQSEDRNARLPGHVHRVMLVVRGMRHEILLKDQQSVVLGRLDQRATARPDVDLTPFGGATRGVSREHVRLTVRDHHLYLTDLGSTNGSFFRGDTLPPREPRLLHSGDEVILGRLAIRFILDDAENDGMDS